MRRLPALCATVTILANLVLGAVAVPASAQGASGNITGTVHDASGASVQGASVQVSGSQTLTTQSDASGTFAVPDLPAGLYEIRVQKPSFEPATESNIVVTAGAPVTVNIVLQPTSFSDLHVIGRASTGPRASAINTSTAAISSISANTILDQGFSQVTQALNETPGIVTTMQGASGFPNGANEATPQVPQIRGALPYETESLIDGHPVSVGATGYFSPLYISPYLLQGIDIVKGPGAMPDDINYAIGGSVNYRTLEPTPVAHQQISLNLDSFGGLSSYVRATGTTGKLGYAVAAGINGTPGDLANYHVGGYPSQLYDGTNQLINGVPICGTAAKGSSCLISGGASMNPSLYGSYTLHFPITICCTTLSDASTIRSELAKLRYNFSQQTSLTLSYLGGQADQNNGNTYTWNALLFSPPAGYSGSIAPGTTLPYGVDAYQPYASFVNTTQGLAQAELRTSLGPTSLLFRYYTGANDTNRYFPFGQTVSFTADTWGGLPIGPGGSTVFFNGQPETYSTTGSGVSEITQDHFSGLSGEVDLPVGANEFSLSYDRTQHSSYAGNLYELPGLNTTSIPNGSSQEFTTFLVRAQLALGSKLNATLGNYFINYNTHFTPNGGISFSDASHSFYGPRLAFEYRADTNTSIRLAAGSSIAPPYLTLVTTAGGPPVANSGAAAYYTQVINNGNINPETAFGYDLGADRRLSKDTVLTGDVYLTSLHGQFLNTVTQTGTYTAATGIAGGVALPLYTSEAVNLGSSRYDGVELALTKTPASGLGYKLQGSLIRAYAYNLPPGFYTTGAGPNTTNLGVYPYVNFTPQGANYTGLGYGRVPYAIGYGELNYRKGPLFALLGVQYEGANNDYNEPAFAIVNAAVRWAFNKRASLQLSGYNLTNAYSSPFAALNAGIPVPLVNGKLGATTAINVGPPTAQLTLKVDLGH